MIVKPNARNQGDGLEFLKSLADNSVAACFFDPPIEKDWDLVDIEVNSVSMLECYFNEIARILKPSGHIFHWIPKSRLIDHGLRAYAPKTLQPVDLIVWGKQGNSSIKPDLFNTGEPRTPNTCEFLAVYQKHPIRAKGIWTDHSIPNVWEESLEYHWLLGKSESCQGGRPVANQPANSDSEFWYKIAKLKRLVGHSEPNDHPHAKPIGLQTRLIKAVTRGHDVNCMCEGHHSNGDPYRCAFGVEYEIIIDPCAGGYYVLEAVNLAGEGRVFMGVDING